MNCMKNNIHPCNEKLPIPSDAATQPNNGGIAPGNAPTKTAKDVLDLSGV